MEKHQLTILGNTCLALASGLFTGGVVTSLITEHYSKEILLELFFPAFALYYLYIVVNVLKYHKNLKISDPWVIISILIALLFGIHIIFF